MAFWERDFGIVDLGGGRGMLGDIGASLFGEGEQTTVTEPWGPQQPYLKDLFGESKRLYDQGGQLTPDMSGLTQQYLTGLPGQVQQGQGLLTGAGGYLSDVYGGQYSPLSGQAGDYLKSAASGEFVGSNPYLDQMYEQGAEKIGRTFSDITMPGINQTFGSSAGAFGSGAHTRALEGAQGRVGEALGDLYTGIYAPAYESERGRQQQAAMGLGQLGIQDINTRLGASRQLPGLATTNLGLFGELGRAGQIPEQFQRERLMEPWQRLGLYGQNISDQYGGTTASPGPSPFDRILGYGADIATIATPFLPEK